jgi:hypothetical protein
MTFISHIDARHILMHNVPARIFALKPPLDFLALARARFLPRCNRSKVDSFRFAMANPRLLD